MSFPERNWHNSQIQISLHYGALLNMATVPLCVALTGAKIQRAHELQHTLPMAQAIPDADLSPYLPQT